MKTEDLNERKNEHPDVQSDAEASVDPAHSVHMEAIVGIPFIPVIPERIDWPACEDGCYRERQSEHDDHNNGSPKQLPG